MKFMKERANSDSALGRHMYRMAFALALTKLSWYFSKPERIL